MLIAQKSFNLKDETKYLNLNCFVSYQDEM